MNPKNPIKTTAIAAIVGIAIIIIISILALNDVFHSNPYGPEQKITNFSRYFKNVPTATRDMLYTGLYNIVALNLGDQTPYPNDVAATIRNNTANSEYDENTDIHHDSFVVDVTHINQSFDIWFEWSNDENNPNLSGYQISITCTSDSSTCKDSSSVANPIENLYNDNPILTYLPLDVSFYANTYSGYVHYTVTYELVPDIEHEDRETIELVITDYTGGNYDRAIAKLKTYQNDLSKYTIRYDDESEEAIPGRPPASDIVD